MVKLQGNNIGRHIGRKKLTHGMRIIDTWNGLDTHGMRVIDTWNKLLYDTNGMRIIVNL